MQSLASANPPAIEPPLCQQCCLCISIPAQRAVLFSGCTALQSPVASWAELLLLMVGSVTPQCSFKQTWLKYSSDHTARSQNIRTWINSSVPGRATYLQGSTKVMLEMPTTLEVPHDSYISPSFVSWHFTSPYFTALFFLAINGDKSVRRKKKKKSLSL